ncbi:MAG: hypothetical protein ABFD14_13760 [Anaerolineaceae bacterium]
MSAGGKSTNQVFINCPFDEKYKSLLRPLLFTVCYLGFQPQIASGFLNSANNRIDKICDLIRSSKYSIHDLSKCISSKQDEYFRMNMPFEFGIDYGDYFFIDRNKKMLVLEGKRYDYQKALSDISGVDVKSHNNEPEGIVKCIRNWIIEARILDKADSPTQIWYRFNDFASDFYTERKSQGFSDDDLNDMPTPEYIVSIEDWIIKNVKS